MRRHLLSYLFFLCFFAQIFLVPSAWAKSNNKFIFYMETNQSKKLVDVLKAEKEKFQKKKYQKYRELYLDTTDKKTGQTPLIAAIDNELPEVAKLLLEAGVKVNHQDEKGISALMVAAQQNEVELVELLLAKGANYQLRNQEGESSFDLAKAHNAKDVLSFFEKKGLIPKVTGDALLDGVHGAQGTYRPDLDTDDRLVKFIPEMDAYDVYSNLHVQSSVWDNTSLPVFRAYPSNKGLISFGAEKEGYSAHIVNVATPRSDIFREYVWALSHGDRKEFLQDLMSGISKGDYRQDNVKDKDGNPININYGYVFGSTTNFDSLHTYELESIFKRWLDQTRDHPFTFLKAEVRRDIFLGYYPSGHHYSSSRAHTALKYLGYRKLELIKNYSESLERKYKWPWLPHFGLSERFIDRIVTAAEFKSGVYLGWEINTHIIRSEGEYENFLQWMRESFKNDEKDEICTAPGHQRMVWPQYKGLCESRSKEIHEKMMEFYRHVQAYLLVKTVSNKTGILAQKWQQALMDDEFMEDNLSDKGIIRKEFNRWGKDTAGIEIRTGVKNIESQRMIQKSLAARVVSQDWDDMAKITSWKLIPDYLTRKAIFGSHAISEMAERFGVTTSEMSRALNAIANSKVVVPEWDWTGCYTGYRQNYMSLIPFWYWEKAPYLSPAKKEFIKMLTAELIRHAGKIGGDYWKMRNAIADWAKSSNLYLNIMDYLRPNKKWSTNLPEPQLYPYGSQRPVVDVNQIDMGIEYTARYPIAAISTRQEGVPLTHNIDLTDQERRRLFLSIGKALAQNLGYQNADIQEIIEKNAHGHGISLSVGVTDPQNPQKKWKVEWDGIQRIYGKDGQRLTEYQGGGHIELVTPKFVPTFREISAVYKTFKDFSLVPIVTAGAAHINIDLAPFEGNPHAFARFLGTFYSYRGILAMMFQHVNRLRTAEPLEINPNLQRAFTHFNGTEEELKQLLYKYTHFNTRMGRKSRYIQLDIASYFQDVIPAHLISNDFDIINPTVPWRPQFRVSPHVRKMEFRMFDAPRNAYEAALQIKMVRAMLNKAFNSSAEISLLAQDVRHEFYVKNPRQAFAELKILTRDLGLNFNEYKGLLGEAISKNQISITKKGFKSYSVRMDRYPKLDREWWGNPVSARSIDEGIDHKGRDYDPQLFMNIPQLNSFNEARLKKLSDDEDRRIKLINKLPTNHAFKRDLGN